MSPQRKRMIGLSILAVVWVMGILIGNYITSELFIRPYALFGGSLSTGLVIIGIGLLANLLDKRQHQNI